MGLFSWLSAGRRKKEPDRQTQSYLKFGGLGSQCGGTRKPVKPSLRRFSYVPFARRAINALKNPIGSLDWVVVPADGVTENAVIRQQMEAVKVALTYPNQVDSFRVLLDQVIEDVCMGAGCIEIQPSGNPVRPVFLFPVDGTTIGVDPKWDGKANSPHYFQFISTREAIPLLDREIIYIRPNPTTASPFGVGPLEVAFTAIERQLRVGDFAASVADNTQPSNLLIAGEEIDGAGVQALRVFWRNEIDGKGVMPIVGGPKGIDVKSLHSTGDDAMYLKYQEFLIREIAAAFDLSPQNLSLERDVNRNTSLVNEGRDWDHAIKPLARLIQSHLNRDVIKGVLGFSSVEFRFEGLDQEDEEKNSTIYATYYENNVVTPNEQREKLGLAPLKNSKIGDMTYMEAAAQFGPKRVQESDQPPGPSNDKPSKKPPDNTGKKDIKASADDIDSKWLALFDGCIKAMGRDQSITIAPNLNFPEGFVASQPVTVNQGAVNVKVPRDTQKQDIHVTAQLAMPDNMDRHVTVPVNVTVPERSVNVSSPTVNVEQPNITIEPTITLEPVVVPPAEVTVQAAAPAITVSPSIAPAPVVTVTVPDELRITSMPTRVTDTSVERDAHGDIKKSTQVERDQE